MSLLNTVFTTKIAQFNQKLVVTMLNCIQSISRSSLFEKRTLSGAVGRFRSQTWSNQLRHFVCLFTFFKDLLCGEKQTYDPVASVSLLFGLWSLQGTRFRVVWRGFSATSGAPNLGHIWLPYVVRLATNG